MIFLNSTDGFAAPIFNSLKTWILSKLMISVCRSLAKEKATSVLPVAVGPQTITRVGVFNFLDNSPEKFFKIVKIPVHTHRASVRAEMRERKFIHLS